MPTYAQMQAASTIDAQIAQTTRDLEAALLRFTDKHPDVLALRETIARLQERRQQEVGGVGPVSVEGRDGSASIDGVVQNLQMQLNSTDVQIAALEAQAAETTRRISTLQQAVAAAPEVEAAFNSLTRDYDVTRQQYQQLLQRLEIARVSRNVDKDPESKFRIVEPPTIPSKPVGLGRRVLLLAISIVSVGGGFGVALALSLLAPVFVAKRQLQKTLDLPVIGAIREMLSDEEETKRRFRNRRFFAVATALALFTIALMIVADPLSHQVRALMERSA